MSINFPSNPDVDDIYSEGGKTWRWTGNRWAPIFTLGYSGSLGFTGSKGDIGYTGSRGFTGSRGDTGFIGSQGDIGYTGSRGFTGSRGDTGFTGSRGDTGFTGSKGDIGYTGSRGDTGFTGSRGDTGFTGSKGNLGYTGSAQQWILISTNTTLVAGVQYITDTSGGGFTVTLPATPSLGDTIWITDGDDWSSNNLIIDGNGSEIEGVLDDVVVNIEGITIICTYTITNGWQISATVGAKGYTGSQGNIGYTGSRGSTGDIDIQTFNSAGIYEWTNPFPGSSCKYTIEILGSGDGGPSGGTGSENYLNFNPGNPGRGGDYFVWNLVGILPSTVEGYNGEGGLGATGHSTEDTGSTIGNLGENSYFGEYCIASKENPMLIYEAGAAARSRAMAGVGGGNGGSDIDGPPTKGWHPSDIDDEVSPNGGLAGTEPGGNGGNGSSTPMFGRLAGYGGGGGGNGDASNDGGNGGNGGIGAVGGGGGGAPNGRTSGNGGPGGHGCTRIITVLL